MSWADAVQLLAIATLSAGGLLLTRGVSRLMVAVQRLEERVRALEARVRGGGWN